MNLHADGWSKCFGIHLWDGNVGGTEERAKDLCQIGSREDDMADS